MLTYKRLNLFEAISYLDFDYIGCVDTKIIEYGNARILENGNISRSEKMHD